MKEIQEDVFLDNDEREIRRIFPDKKLRLKISEMAKIPFGFIWIIGGYFILFDNFNTKSGILIQIFRIIFLIAGVYILFGRFILKWIEINYSEYIITDKRIIIKNTFLKRIKSLNYNEFSATTIGKYNKNFGYIIFGKSEPFMVQRGLNYSENRFLFENVRNAKEIDNQIKHLKRSYEEKIDNESS